MSKEVLILVLSSLGLCQALFLCAYLFTLKKGERSANILLALVILGLTIRIGKSVLNVYLDLEPWQRNLGLSGVLLTGPSLWLYGKVLLTGEKWNSQYLRHFLVFVLFALFAGWIANNGSIIGVAVYCSVFAHLALYLILSFRIFANHRKQVHPQKSNWYRNLVIGVSFLWVYYMGHLSGIFSFYIGGALSFSLLIYIFSFLFLQKHAFQLGKYNASKLDSSASEEIMKRLKALFQREEVYLESTLTLENVAKDLKVTPRILSQAINQTQQTNFSGFVNHYRIEKAKNLLQQPKYQKEKIASVAFDCGFGNVTSFNLAFKAQTQKTPSQYRNAFFKT
ncbi:MAG: AraC family transcriptional regulator [Bacteroidota bacterium]